jgi:hypothetical protein
VTSSAIIMYLHYIQSVYYYYYYYYYDYVGIQQNYRIHSVD